MRLLEFLSVSFLILTRVRNDVIIRFFFFHQRCDYPLNEPLFVMTRGVHVIRRDSNLSDLRLSRAARGLFLICLFFHYVQCLFLMEWVTYSNLLCFYVSLSLTYQFPNVIKKVLR